MLNPKQPAGVAPGLACMIASVQYAGERYHVRDVAIE